jgi:hypothetical protein
MKIIHFHTTFILFIDKIIEYIQIFFIYKIKNGKHIVLLKL